MDENSNSLADEMISYLRPPSGPIDEDQDSEIGQFYAGRSVLVTGSTGFIGKVNMHQLCFFSY